MKTLGVIISLQTVLIVVLIYKVFGLESKISKPSSQQPKPVQHYEQSFDKDMALKPSLVVDYQKIREVVREEVSHMAAENSAGFLAQNNISTDPDMLEATNAEVVNILVDGKITESELAVLERQMVNLNKRDRQRVLNMLAKQASNNSIIITPK